MESGRAVVIYNGPSRPAREDVPQADQIIGCNFAYRDYRLTDLVAADRFTVARIRQDPDLPRLCRFYTRTSGLELPPGWHQHDSPGIDSGSLAVSVALDRCQRVLVLGADGICGGDQTSAYHDLYVWHQRVRARNIHRRHRQGLQLLTRQHPGRICVVWPEPVEQLETLPFDQALEWFQ